MAKLYNIDFEAKDKAKGFIRKFFLHPEHWIDINNHISITLNWHSIQFNEANLKHIPETKGVYCFVVKPEVPNFFETSYLFYVGKTEETFRVRYNAYLRDQQGKNKKARAKVYEMLEKYADNLYYYYAEITSDSDIKMCEELLINTFIPSINSQIPIAKIKPELKNLYE